MRGYVSEIVSRDTSFGTMYDIVVDGKNYGAGKFPPKNVKEGDFIEFEYTQNGRFNRLTAGSVKKVPAPAGSAPSTNGGGSRSGGYAKRDDSTQDTIAKQSALNSAIAWLNVLASTDSLPLAKTTAKEKKPDIMDAILHRYRAQFYQESTGKEWPADESTASLEDDLSAMESEDWNEQ